MTEHETLFLTKVRDANDSHAAPPPITHAVAETVAELQRAGLLDSTGRRVTDAGRKALGS